MKFITYIQSMLSSSRTMIVLMVVFAAALALATIVENHLGTLVARKMVYHAPAFFVLLALMVANFICMWTSLIRNKKQKWGMFVVHGAFIVILTGALHTHIFGLDGLMHIREGQTTNVFMVQDGDVAVHHRLPFDVELKDFTLSRYPGSESPSSFQSNLVLHTKTRTFDYSVYMNHILDLEGYRFFQSSFDPDEMGTVLSVNKDVVGRRITYTGYFLLLVGFVWMLLSKYSRFSALRRQLRQLKTAAFVLVLLCSSQMTIGQQVISAASADELRYTVGEVTDLHLSDEHVSEFAEMPMQSAIGRLQPVSTFASQILRKVHGETEVGAYDANTFFLSLLALPELWMHVEFILVDNEQLQERLGLSTPYCAYAQLFDADDQYVLQSELMEVSQKKLNERSKYDKELLKLDEKSNILFQLWTGQMLRLFPCAGAENNAWVASGDELSVYEGTDSLFVSKVFAWYLEEVRGAIGTRDWTKSSEVLGMIHTYQTAKCQMLEGEGERRIEVEYYYNELNPFKGAKMGYLILGGLLLVFSFVSLFTAKRWITTVEWLLMVGIFHALGLHTLGILLRWYIAGYVPMTNSYETMVFVAWSIVVAGSFFARKNKMTFALALLLAGVVLFVATLNWMDPHISTLVPVLKSPWLMSHVTTIMAAYGFFGICSLLGWMNLGLWYFKDNVHIEQRVRELTVVSQLAMWLGLALMTVGCFLGAIWANESWGRYWGWDPKETWALITMVVYAVIIHLHLVRTKNYALVYNICAALAILVVLMTYFGVNMFFSGMHSYNS